MTDTREQRIGKIDEAIACHHNAHLAAIWADHEDEATYHTDEEDRLLNLRQRVERGLPLSMITEPSAFDVEDTGPVEYVRFVVAPADVDEW